jgi:hypothetical protein
MKTFGPAGTSLLNLVAGHLANPSCSIMEIH